MNLIINFPFYSSWIYFDARKLSCKTKFGTWSCKAKRRSTRRQLHPYLQTHIQNLQTHCIRISRHLIDMIRFMIKACLYRKDRREKPNRALSRIFAWRWKTIRNTIKTLNFDLREHIFHVLLMTYAKKKKKTEEGSNLIANLVGLTQWNINKNKVPEE